MPNPIPTSTEEFHETRARTPVKEFTLDCLNTIADAIADAGSKAQDGAELVGVIIVTLVRHPNNDIEGEARNLIRGEASGYAAACCQTLANRLGTPIPPTETKTIS